MYNMSGDIVKRTTTIARRQRIDISGLSQGAYFVEVKNKEGSRLFKMVKL